MKEIKHEELKFKEAKLKMTKVQVDDDGNMLLPKGYKLYKEEDPQDIVIRRIAELESELSRLKEPTDAELIEEGKNFNLWHMMSHELTYLRR